MRLDELIDGIRFVLSAAGSSQPLHKRLKHLIDVGLGRGRGTRELMEIRCERGAEIARQIGFSASTATAIRALDEHWDGKGHPYGVAAEDIPLLGRILGLAQTVEVFFTRSGPAAAMGMARERSGTWFDPDLVEAFERVQSEPGFWTEVARADIEDIVSSLEPSERILTTDEAQLDRVAEAFARVIDAKSPWTYRHSERVRGLSLGAAWELGIGETELRTLSRAALLHDLGKLAVSNQILDKKGRLTTEELAIIQKHPAHTQHILERVASFAAFAEMAGAHHERMDGSGYHRGSAAGSLSQEARILAVADQYEALTAHRPYREGMSPETALSILRSETGKGVCPVAFGALERFLASPGGAELEFPENLPEDLARPS